MKKEGHNQVDQIVEAVRGSRKYRHICQEFIEAVGSEELVKQRTLKEAIKATKNKLHQVGGAYLEGELPYTMWLEELRGAAGRQDEIRRACTRMMAYHASTRERLPILERFYETLLTDLPPIKSVMDIACGLHPLGIPWMPLAEGIEYYAYDIYEDMMGFLNGFFNTLHIWGIAQTCDVIWSCPTRKVDLAFLLKALPCLEQVDKSLGLRLLDEINADYVLVSFPAQSLGGRKREMGANYEARFREMIAGKDWLIERFGFESEVVFRIVK